MSKVSCFDPVRIAISLISFSERSDWLVTAAPILAEAKVHAMFTTLIPAYSNREILARQ